MSQMGAEQHSPTKQPCCDLVHVSPKDQGHCLSAALSCICSPGRGCRCTEVWAGFLQPTCSCVSGRPWLSLSPRLCGDIHLKGRRGNYTHFVKCVQCWATAPGRAVLGAQGHCVLYGTCLRWALHLLGSRARLLPFCRNSETCECVSPFILKQVQNYRKATRTV